MALVGILYLFFNESILSSEMGSSRSEPSLKQMSKSIIGVQVGLILLAMIVTRSSVASLQAKQGLPFGNQVTGWVVLGKAFSYHRGAHR